MTTYPIGAVVGFMRTIPKSPGHYTPGRGPGPRIPAVRVCCKGIIISYVGKNQAIVYSTTLGWKVQIYLTNIVDLWNNIGPQTLTELRMASRAKTRQARERTSARREQFRKQLPLPL